MTKTFGEMDVICTGVVSDEKEKPTVVEKPDQVDFDIARVGSKRAMQYPKQTASICLKEGWSFVGKHPDRTLGDASKQYSREEIEQTGVIGESQA